MKVLFLDVDGVLNNENSFRLAHTSMNVDGDCVLRLKRVIDATGAEIVLSSTWRLLREPARELRRWLDWAGVKPWVAVTPDLRRNSGRVFRGTEIKAWLEADAVTYGRGSLAIDRYAIVDDDGDMLPAQLPCFVQTSVYHGLTDADAGRLIAILNGEALPHA